MVDVRTSSSADWLACLAERRGAGKVDPHQTTCLTLVKGWRTSRWREWVHLPGDAWNYREDFEIIPGMGGPGSGRERDLGLETVESTLSVAITPLVRMAAKRDGLTQQVRLWDGLYAWILIDLQDHDLVLVWGGKESHAVLEKTPIPNGGHMWVVHCPSCRSLTRTLFVRRQEPHLRCRECAGLSYESQHLDPMLLAARDLGELRVRVGGPEYRDLRLPFPPRPDHMRRRTYQTLATAAAQLRSILLGLRATGKRERDTPQLRRQTKCSKSRVDAILAGQMRESDLICRLGPAQKADSEAKEPSPG